MKTPGPDIPYRIGTWLAIVTAVVVVVLAAYAAARGVLQILNWVH